MDKLFYERVKPLDNCKGLLSPTKPQVELVLEMISDEKIARYFFDNLENPIWAPILEQYGYYLNAPKPVEVEKGSFRIPTWPAAIYLFKVAKSVPQVVLSVVNKIETDNSRVQELLLDALAEISPEDSIQAFDKITQWFPSRFTDFIPVKYGVLIEKWLQGGFVATAIPLFEKLITPFSNGLDNKPENLYHPPIKFGSDPYWINEVVLKQYSVLLDADCEGMFAAYDRQVRHFVEIAEEIVGDNVNIYTGSRWRPDIPFRSSISGELEIYDILIDGLRDALINLCKKMPDKGGEKLSLYIDDDHIIFKRLGFYALRSFGQQFPNLLEQILGNKGYFENEYFYSEYKGLLRDQFGNISTTLQQIIMEWILEGPLNADELFNSVGIDDEYKKKKIDIWKLRYFALIHEFLPQSFKDIYEELIDKYGKPDVKETPKISASVSWGGVPSPISVDELTKMSLNELFDLIKTFESDDPFERSIESLGQAFRSIVENNPIKYRDLAHRLIESGIRNIYVYNYLNGVSEAIKNGKEKLSEEVVALCESVVEKEEDKRETPDSYGVSLVATQLQAGWLIENTLRSDDPYLTEGLLSRVKGILFILAKNPNPLPEDDGGSFDPFTQSMNCVRGVAMHAIMHYLLYTDRQRKKTGNKESYKPSMDVEAQQVLQDKLDISKDPSLAVHSVFGAYLPQLYYLDHDWVIQNIQRIFPESDDHSKYWQASWDAYISSSNVYRGVFELLVSHYQRALQLLSVPRTDKKPWISPDERLAQHIMFVYINEFTDFGHENNLLDLFFDNASDEVRSRAVFWLRKVLDDAKPSSNDELWKRLWKMWRARVDTAIVSEETIVFRHEISDYMRWLANAPVDLGFLIDILQQSIKFLNDGYSVQLMASFSAKHCERYPQEAVRLIHDAIMSVKEPWWLPEIKDEETILRTAIASGNANAKDVAIEVINYRGEQGDFRWKYLLE